jgi:predicted nucleic acid-binding Zn ribbon protein
VKRYGYRCADHGEYDGDHQTKAQCPTCKRVGKRTYTVSAIHLKGDGFTTKPR